MLSADPFHKTCEAEMKPVPATVRLNAGLPATVLDGDKDVKVGAGFGATILKLSPAEVPPPGWGLRTVTVADPAAAKSDAGTCACRLVLETNVVASAAPFH